MQNMCKGQYNSKKAGDSNKSVFVPRWEASGSQEKDWTKGLDSTSSLIFWYFLLSNINRYPEFTVINIVNLTHTLMAFINASMDLKIIFSE